MSQLQQAAQILLQPNTPFSNEKAQALDFVTQKFYRGMPQESQQAHHIWDELKKSHEFWTQVDSVIQVCQLKETKFLALKTLEEQIKTMWNLINNDSKNTIKTFIVNLLLQQGAKPQQGSDVDPFTSQVNITVIQILKHEWQTTWKNFIPDICAASKQDQNICENNLRVLKLLSEEIFDFSKNQMTQQQIAELKQTLNQEFAQIYELCYFLLIAYIQNPQQVKESLVKQTLECLLTYLTWIPIGYIFLTELIETLLKMMDQATLRNQVLRCLTEIVNLKIEESEPQLADQAKQQRLKLYTILEVVLTKLKAFFPCDYGFVQERMKLRKINQSQVFYFDEFCQILALFFTGFLTTHLSWIEQAINGNQHSIQVLHYCFQYLIGFTELPSESTFKICVEFWHQFTQGLLTGPFQMKTQSEPLVLNLYGNQAQEVTLKNSVYPKVLIDLRKIIISRMAKPQEVLITLDEDGQPCREEITNTENSAMYELLKELLISLSKLNWNSTRDIVVQKLDRQMDGTEWSFENLNSICWAIGSLSGCLPDQDEKSFLIHTIRTLLNLCEQKKGKENKAVVASNIMYVVGQYPKFLKANWNFHKTVIKKLFEFMKEQFPGVQEMSCNTFLKICKLCGKEMVIKQKSSDNPSEQEPYIYELIRTIQQETAPLESQNKLIFYESLGHVIRQEDNLQVREQLLKSLLSNLFEQFQILTNTPDIINIMMNDNERLNWLINYLKINERVAFAVGFVYLSIIQQLAPYLIQYYVSFSQLLEQKVQTEGKYILVWHTIKRIRLFKREVIKLLQTYLNSLDAQEGAQQVVRNLIIQPLADLLKEYKMASPELREPEVLLLFAKAFEKLKNSISDIVPEVISAVFESTIGMISQDFNSYPDHRLNFFEFIKTAVTHEFVALFNMPPDQFKLLIDCTIWAAKHELPHLHDLGLDVLKFILEVINPPISKNLSINMDIASQFYGQYYIRILKDVLEITTDQKHKSGFKLQASILHILFQVAQSDKIKYNFSGDLSISNAQFVYKYLVDTLSSAFPNIPRQDTELHIQKMFANSGVYQNFKNELSDYVINLGKFHAVPGADGTGGQQSN